MKRMNVRALLLYFLLASPVLCASVEGQNFSNPVRIPTGQDPYSVSVADLNGDGRPDLIYGISGVNSTPGAMKTFLAQPSGGYAPGPTLPMPLIVGDAFNFEFFALLGDGAGHFTISSTNLSNGVLAVPLYTVDLNGDGKPDIVSSVGPYVYLGNGNGTFAGEKSYGAFNSCNYADMERDGHLDAVCILDVIQQPADIYTENNELAILHGNGDGSFNTTPVASQIFGDQGGAGAIESPLVMADVNGDGIPDIIAVSQDGVSVLLGQPNLQFAPPVRYAVSNYGYIYATTSQVIDLNGDGYPDIVSTGASGLYISYGNKDGTFNAPPAYPVADALGRMTVADFNGDGIPDIAATGDDSIELSLGKGDGTFQPFVALPNGGISFAGGVEIAHGDFRGTGKQDILAVGSTGTYQYDTFVLFNDGGRQQGKN